MQETGVDVYTNFDCINSSILTIDFLNLNVKLCSKYKNKVNLMYPWVAQNHIEKEQIAPKQIEMHGNKQIGQISDYL